MQANNRSITGFISYQDSESLGNLAKIKSSNQLVDIDSSNGAVSPPYESSWLGNTYTWISGSSENKDIEKVMSLMHRALVGYFHGCGELEVRLKEAINGLKLLHQGYREKKCDSTCMAIEGIIQFVERNISKIKKNEESKQHNLLNFNITNLEASTIGARPIQIPEALKFYRDRIKDFLFLEKEEIKDSEFIEEFDFQLIDRLSEEDCTFLKNLDFALEETASGKRGKGQPIEILIEKFENEGFDRSEAVDKAFDLTKRQRSESLLDDLDQMPTDYQSEVGILIPMRFIWYDDNQEESHAFYLSLCREPDGTYTAAQINAGGLSLIDYNKSHMNFHFNSATYVSLSFPPVVEFPGLSKEEAINFLTRAYSSNTCESENYTEAKSKYSSLFSGIDNKFSTARIPARRSQITGNCSLRSLKELLIYSFQKSNKHELGNKFMKYVDGRSNKSLPFEDIKPLQSK